MFLSKYTFKIVTVMILVFVKSEPCKTILISLFHSEVIRKWRLIKVIVMDEFNLIFSETFLKKRTYHQLRLIQWHLEV